MESEKLQIALNIVEDLIGLSIFLDKDKIKEFGGKSYLTNSLENLKYLLSEIQKNESKNS